MSDLGILYLAKGEEYQREATISAKRTKEVMPDVPMTIVTHEKFDTDVFSQQLVDNTGFSKTDKPNALLRTPYQRTIFLDTDIYLEQSIEETYALLNEFDMAVATNPADTYLKHTVDYGVEEAFPEFNTGVIVYKSNEAVREFLRDWRASYEFWHRKDQPSFRQVLYESDVRFAPLRRRYNYMYRDPAHLVGEVKVFHGALLEHRGADMPRHELSLDNAKSINDRGFSRVSFKLGDGLVVNPPRSLLHYLAYYLLHTGVRTTAKKIAEYAYEWIVSDAGDRLREFVFQRRSGEYVAIEVGGVTAQFRSADARVSERDFRDDIETEANVVRDLLEEVDDSDTFYDVGAGVGVYACFVGNAIDDGSVVAFEAHPAQYEALVANCEANGIDATLYDVALGDDGGGPDTATQSLADAGGSALRDGLDAVPGDKLAQADGLTGLDVCKIDVSGRELDVVTGLRKTLSRTECRAVYCRLYPDAVAERGDSIENLFDLLRELGYDIGHIMDGSRNAWLKATKSVP